MNCKLRTNRAFTLIELTVAVAALTVVLSIVGVVFNISIESYRIATANAEIMLKLRAITEQLNRDFRGLRKDGEIFIVWAARPDSELGRHVRFDRIMFFADGDFYTYNPPYVRGNLARISYMLARLPDWPGGPDRRAPNQERQKRILTRNQHILTADSDAALVGFPSDFGSFADPAAFEAWLGDWHNIYEYDKIALAKWLRLPWQPGKADLLSAITDTNVGMDPNMPLGHRIGSMLSLTDLNDSNSIAPESVHMILCQGVGEFKIQGWHERLQRWVPMVDPNGDGDFLSDTDFILNDAGSALHSERIPGVLYPRIDDHHGVSLGGAFAAAVAVGDPNDPHYFEQSWVTKKRFNEIPGLGRALKFTFTLYDSKGVIKNGRTFTHIIYLDN